jgi:23S rRNA (guanine2445-N2)-methyltransferase / 23S rRNA (guanine2069-N7)-methyltransferase
VTRFVSTSGLGTEERLAHELGALGARDVVVQTGAVAFEGDLEAGYRALLWLRSASRLLLPLGEVSAGDPEALYDGVRALPWLDHMGTGTTFAVHCVAARGEGIHTRYWALKTKDAIVDLFRDRTGARPNVDTDRPDLRVHVHKAGETATVSLDLGGPLHMRGYRPSGAPAPLRETLAAALVELAGAAEVADAGGPIVDPLCGSGTLLVEAGLLARDVAPGLLRDPSGPSRWRAHDAPLWDRLVTEARERRAAGASRPLVLVGSDRSARAIELARESLARAGLLGAARLERRPLEAAEPPAGFEPGLVLTNPPYGDRLGEAAELFTLYQSLGDVLRRRFLGYRVGVLTTRGRLGKNLGLKPDARHLVMNGPIECAFLTLRIREAPVRAAEGPTWRKPSAEAPMFDNRLRKNLRRFGRFAKREGIDAYRVYDADIPEYNVAVDRYGDHVHVQEYAPPRSVDPARAETHLKDVLLVVPDALGVPAENVHLKVRRRQRAGGQYEAEDVPEVRLEVHEDGLAFEVELSRHLDTGLFLDHRLLRARAAKHAAGKAFLNLFAYTCSASVHAARAGARETVSVDLSSTYLEWGRRNFQRNGLDPSRHRFEREGCMAFLERDARTYGVVFLNPPSYSRSKATTGDFDIKRDQTELLEAAMAHVASDGVLFFSTHARGFELDEGIAGRFAVEEISRATVPLDFERSPHRAFEIRHR